MLDLARQFKSLFSGLERAYGTYQVEQKARGVKLKGQAVTHMKPVTIQLWADHLSGKQGIGIVPIKDNSTCQFGAIDIDSYQGLNIANIVKKIKSLGLPLVACRSKSGGCHLFLFCKEEVPADVIQSRLKDMAAALGYGTAEIFPKQTKILTERGDMGTWINMPYFHGLQGLRYAIDEMGSPLSVEDFVALAMSLRQTDATLSAIRLSILPELDEGPPCLQYIIQQGFQEGTRNDGLFNLGVYCRKAFPDNWRDKLEELNQKYMDPPLKSAEVQGVFKSLRKKDYAYTCSRPPIQPFCNKPLCLARAFGVGEEFALPVISNLTKYNSNPPIWFVSVEGGGRLELITEEIQNQQRFQKRCIETLNLMPPIVNKLVWQQVVQKLLDSVVIIEAPMDASTSGQLIEHLERFCTSRVQAQNRDEMLLGKPWHNEKKHYFRMADFMAYLERNHFREFKVNKVTSILKELLKAEHGFFILKGKGVNVWIVPEFQSQTEPHDVPEFENTVPY